MPRAGGLQQRSEVGPSACTSATTYGPYMSLAEGVEPRTMNGIDSGLTLTINWMAFA